MDELLDLIRMSGPHRIILCMFVITVMATATISLLERWFKRKKREDADLLMFMSRTLNKSEYELFHTAAHQWEILDARVDEDFKRYLQHGDIPHYVRHMVRGFNTGNYV